MYIALLNFIKADHEADKKQLMDKTVHCHCQCKRKIYFCPFKYFFFERKNTLYERTFVWKVRVGTFIVNVTLNTHYNTSNTERPKINKRETFHIGQCLLNLTPGSPALASALAPRSSCCVWICPWGRPHCLPPHPHSGTTWSCQMSGSIFCIRCLQGLS